MERHLAAFEAGDADALAALLALLAAATGLALAGTDTASDADLGLAGTLVVAEFVELHDMHSLSLLSRSRPGPGCGNWKKEGGRLAPFPVFVTW